MSEFCAIAGDTKLETPEGALTAKGLAGKSVPVFTRENGNIRFRMLQDVRRVAEGQPVLKVSLENGKSFRVGDSQVFVRKDGSEVPATALKAGDELCALCHYQEGYTYRDDRTGADVVSTGAWKVTVVEPAGTADVYAFSVAETGTFFLSAGVLCRAN